MSDTDVWILDRPEPTAEARALIEELARRGCSAEIVDVDAVTPSCAPPGVVRADRVEKPKVVVVRSRVITRATPRQLLGVFTLLGLIEDGGAAVVNSALSLVTYEDKIRQTSTLDRAGLPVPATRAIRTIEQAETCVAEWHDVILKPPYGHASIDVVRLRAGGDRSALGRREKILVWHLLQRHDTLCAQRFIPNRGRDLRVLVIDEDVVASYFHVATAPDGSTRHPLYPYRWAKAELTPETAGMACQATKQLGFSVASLDIVEGETGPVIIEVNPNISAWVEIEHSEHDHTEHGITHRFADYLTDLLEPR